MSVIELSWTDKKKISKNCPSAFKKPEMVFFPSRPRFFILLITHIFLDAFFVISATCPHRRSSWTMIPSNFREDCTGLLSLSLPTTLFANKQGIIDREAHVFHLRKFSLGMQVGKRVFPSQPMVQRFPNTWVHDRFINQWLSSPSYLCLLSLHYALIPMAKCQ